MSTVTNMPIDKIKTKKKLSGKSLIFKFLEALKRKPILIIEETLMGKYSGKHLLNM